MSCVAEPGWRLARLQRNLVTSQPPRGASGKADMADNSDRRDKDIRARILEAALRILQNDGVKKLTQPTVAKLAGVRQSHLTYYFPKKIDLVIGLLQGHIDGAAARLAEPASGAEGAGLDIEDATRTLVDDQRRMRFFIGLIIEAGEDPKLARMMDLHIRQFNAIVARYFGRDDDDGDVEAFLNALRGYGLVNMVRETAPPTVDVLALAARFGLAPPAARPAAEPI